MRTRRRVCTPQAVLGLQKKRTMETRRFWAHIQQQKTTTQMIHRAYQEPEGGKSGSPTQSPRCNHHESRHIDKVMTCGDITSREQDKPEYCRRTPKAKPQKGSTKMQTHRYGQLIAHEGQTHQVQTQQSAQSTTQHAVSKRSKGGKLHIGGLFRPGGGATQPQQQQYGQCKASYNGHSNHTKTVPTVTEVYSRPRVTAYAKAHASERIKAGPAYDINTGHDFTDEKTRDTVKKRN